MNSNRITSVGFVLALAISMLITGCERWDVLETIINTKTISQSETMKRRFEEYIAALNNHDREKAMAFLAADFQLHFIEYDVQMTKDQMADVMGWDKGVNGVVSYKNLVIEANSVTGLFAEKNDFFKLVGIDVFQAQITYTFNESGMIVNQSYSPLPNQPSFQEKMQPAVAWARENRPDELDEIYDQNQMQFNVETAPRWVALLKEWRLATQNDE